MTTVALDHPREQNAHRQQIPLWRVSRIELRKMFDTRSGFWLMASLVIAALVATAATILFAPHADLTYYTYAKAIGFPMTVILPIIAVLSITGEWSQRSGLTTFTLVPHRNRVILAKVVASVTVGAASMLFALAVGVVGNLVGTAITGTEQVWDVTVVRALQIVLGGLLCLLTGTMLGLLFRSSPVAMVAYFVYSLLLPTVLGVLATSQKTFRDVQPWVDLNLTQGQLFERSLTAEQWAHLGVTASIWLFLPTLVALRLVSRSEVR
jgi:ABC-2 type transport system permease protein